MRNYLRTGNRRPVDLTKHFVRLALLALAPLMLSVGKARAADQPAFNRDIRPILAENCFACHGPDKNTRKAKLRLDLREEAVKSGVIGLIRFMPLGFAMPEWGEALAAAGIFSAFYGVLVGITQQNPKTVLAYSSVSQWGCSLRRSVWGWPRGTLEPR